MAQTIDFRDRIPFPADEVLEKNFDMDFMREWSVVQDAINPQPRLISRDEDKVVVKIDLEEPVPPFGNIKAQLTMNWDLKTRTNNWTRSAEGVGGQSNIFGKTQIVPAGDNECEFIDSINIEVKVPLMGKKIEKKVAEHLKAGRQKKMDYLKKNLG